MIPIAPSDPDPVPGASYPRSSRLYDAASRRTRMTVTGQADVTYGYDNAGRLTGVTQGAATVAFGYDNANRRTSLTQANGVVAAYAYDAASQLTSITYSQGATTIGTLTYAYDNAGRVSGRGGTLFQSILPAAAASATYDADNRLTQWAAASGTLNPTYDANGRQITDGGKGHGSHTLTWDARGRLTAIAATPASFAYDAIGRRTTATIAGIATGYLYDGADIVQELSGATPNATVLTGGGIDERFSRTTGGATSTYLTDFLGSTVALTDSTGAVRTSYAYDPYGATTTTGAANTSAYQFTGRENDGATGLYFYRARYYNPAFGRFISEDPIGLRGGVNLYGYVGGDPVGARDPSGLDSKPPKPCPGGPAVQASGGFGGTSFVDFGGISGALQGGLSIPISSLENLSLSGTQIFLYGELDPMFGLGMFEGVGPQYGAGLGSVMRPGLHGNPVGAHFEGGGAFIGGASGGATFTPDGGSASGSPIIPRGRGGPVAGGGGYFGGGPAFSGQFSSPQLGCHG